jgi:stearoyl-CoA desaturase (Delta-9 desaturase)
VPPAASQTIAPGASRSRGAPLITGLRDFARRHRAPIAVVASVATAAALGFVLAGRRDDFVTALSGPALWLLAVAALLQTVALLARSEAWHVTIQQAGGRVSRRVLYRASSMQVLGGMLNSQLGVAARIAALRRSSPDLAPKVPTLIAAEFPILAIEGTLAALTSFTLVGPLGLPLWLPLVLFAALITASAGLRHLARRKGRELWRGLAVLRCLRGGSRVVGFVLVAVFAQIFRNWLLLHAVGVDASFFDAIAVLIAVVTLGQLPVGPSVGAAAAVLILGHDGVAATAAAGVLLTATGTIGGLGFAAWAGGDHLWARGRRRRGRAVSPAISRADDVEPVSHENLDRTITGLVTAVPVGALVAAVWQTWDGLLRPSDVIVFGIVYLLTGLGVTVGFHRLLTHRSFKAKPIVRGILAVLGSAAIEGPVISWVADHRKHHAFSDRPGDPHSPHVDHGVGWSGALRGLVHAHVGWLFRHDQRGARSRYAPDLLADPAIRFVDRTFPLWAVAGFGLAFGLGVAIGGSVAAGLTALLWGGAVRLLVLHHVTYSINSICHAFGRRSYSTSDHSRNVFWLALPSMGESWHNNHHAFPTSATHGLGRWQIDPSAMVIRALERCGLAWDVVRVSGERKRRAALPGRSAGA